METSQDRSILQLQRFCFSITINYILKQTVLLMSTIEFILLTEKDRETETERQRDRETERHRETERQRDRETERQRQRQRQRQRVVA